MTLTLVFLHVDRTATDYDFIVYDVKYVKSLNRIGSLYIIFNNINVAFRKSGKDKYLKLVQQKRTK